MSEETDKIWSKIEKGVLVVAECDKNYIQTPEDQEVSVYLENAKKLVEEAKSAGADAVKFQSHNVEDEQLNIEIISPHFQMDRYKWVSRSTKATPIREFWLPLKEYCKNLGIILFATPFSRGGAEILEEVGFPFWKVGSGDTLDFVMLDYIAQTKKPIIISSGMNNLEEIDLAVKFLKARNSRIALLHCVTKYPCLPEDLNLKTIEFFQQRYQIPIGLSDHALSVDSSLVAVALGAKIIEKHFSLSRDIWGADHKASMVPSEFKTLVEKIRELESNPQMKEECLKKESFQAWLGQPTKILREESAVFRPIWFKCLMAGINIPQGTVLAPEMIYAMRPQMHAKGLPSEKYEEVLGKKTKVDLKKYDPITFEILERTLDRNK